jgi:pimeloyl-ACP methyl ester carboxylesterase
MIDDGAIPFDEFGSHTSHTSHNHIVYSRPVLHFAHSNAFPPACFRQFLNPFLPHYRVLAAHHRPLWPGSRPEEVTSWQQIADDLLCFLDQQGVTGVIGVGHSLGAVATLLAARLQPELFRTLVLIEPIFLPPAVLQALADAPELIENLPLLRTTRGRRQHWPDRQTAYDHFRARSAFRRWSDEAIWDYVRCGLREDTRTGELELVYSREWEARFYSRPPLEVWGALPHISHPTLAIRGAESDSLFPEAWALWQAVQPAATFVEIPDAGHMVTIERPEKVADVVLGFLCQA